MDGYAVLGADLAETCSSSSPDHESAAALCSFSCLGGENTFFFEEKKHGTRDNAMELKYVF